MNKDFGFQALEEREWALFSERGDFFTRYFGLPISLRITNVYLRLGLTENHASFSMLITGLIGAALMILGPWGILFGSCFLILHHLLDYVDGQLARHYGRASVKGAVLDRWNHFIVETATFPCLAIGLYLDNGAIWSWVAVWILYIWNRLRVLLAQLPANILSEELSQYPVLEREMMRSNLFNIKAQSPNSSSEISSKPETTRPLSFKSRFRSTLCRIRVASTSYNGFTILLGFGALIDVVASQLFVQDGIIHIFVLLLAAYSVLNIVDYSWSYIRSDRVASELTSRLGNTAE